MQIPHWDKKDLIGIENLSRSEIRKILLLAKEYKKNIGKTGNISKITKLQGV